ncbi:MAG: SDR family oxidoreductase [Actinomycetes bacterium]
MAIPLRVLVIGAGRGIGRSITVKLLDLGHDVAVCSRTKSDLDLLIEGRSNKTLVIAADVTTPGAAEEVIEEVVSTWGGIDVLLLNAGDGISAPIDKTTDQMWDHMLELNLSAPFKFIRAAVPHMKLAKNGQIIVIASKAGLVGEPNVAAYTAAKHGVVGLVRAAASELSRYGITVNAVCPDYVDTPMTQRTLQAAADRTGKAINEVKSTLESKLSGGRLLTADEVAVAAISFIGDSSKTGITQLLEGGR